MSLPPPNEYPRYNIKLSDDEGLDLDLGNVEYPFIAIAPRSTLTQHDSTW